MKLTEKIKHLQELAGIEEGTWAIPKNETEKQKVREALNILLKLKKDLYTVLGDDILYDHLDGAVYRINELMRHK